MDAKEFSQLLKDHPEILENRKQFQSILRDIYPSERGNVNLMITAHSAGVMTLLRRNIPRDFRAVQITRLLADDYSIAVEKARWAAQLWVEAYELSRRPEVVGLEETDLKWFQTKENDTGCAIVKYLDSGDGEVVIPPQIGGLPVTEIGKSAFYSCRSLTSVVIPEGVTEIGWWAFDGCRSLASIVIPGGISKIGWFTFYGCSSLASIVIPEGVSEIGESAFKGCRSLTSVVIPQSVEDIGKDVFKDCPHLKIQTPAGSFAEQYAKKAGIPVTLIQ